MRGERHVFGALSREEVRAEPVEKLILPVLVPTLVAVVGGASFIAIKDLKPIHLETGEGSHSTPTTPTMLACVATPCGSHLNIEAPIDSNGSPCLLPSEAKAHMDRPELGPYFLASATVSLQLTWLDAITNDETEAGQQVLVAAPFGAAVQKM